MPAGLTRLMARRRPNKFRRRQRKYRIRRKVLYNPTPTFVETVSLGATFANVGGVFSVRISDIPQVAQYSNLYKQYRINWVKVMIVPDFNTGSADNNAAQYNATIPTGNVGMARIAWAVNDSPALVAPATEAQLLEDNGCKVKPLTTIWSQVYRPVADISVTGTGGQLVPIKTKQKSWFNFLAQNNPLHYGVSYYITQPVNGLNPVYNVYTKICFSLRDPQ